MRRLLLEAPAAGKGFHSLRFDVVVLVEEVTLVEER
jgi:hypothetical protein